MDVPAAGTFPRRSFRPVNDGQDQPLTGGGVSLESAVSEQAQEELLEFLPLVWPDCGCLHLSADTDDVTSLREAFYEPRRLPGSPE